MLTVSTSQINEIVDSASGFAVVPLAKVTYDDEPYKCAVSAAGEHVAVCRARCGVYVLRTAALPRTDPHTVLPFTAWTAVFARTPNTLICGGRPPNSGEIAVFDIDSDTLLRSRKVQSDTIFSIHQSHNSRFLASASGYSLA